MYNARIKQNIRQRRKELGFTQGQMAEKLGVDDRTYKLIESEKGTRMFYERVDQIAEVLETSLFDLLQGGFSVMDADSDDEAAFLRENESALECEIANLRMELAECQQKIVTLQQDIARLNGCIDDKDYIIRRLKDDLQERG